MSRLDTAISNKKFYKGYLLRIIVYGGAISLLAAIPVPGYLEAQTRAKVSRATADIRDIASALEKYEADKGSYPAWTMDSAQSVNAYLKLTDTRPTFRAAGGGLQTLTTPTAYIAPGLADPFGERLGRAFNYYTSGNDRYVLWSVGPDRDQDLSYTLLGKIESDDQLKAEIEHFRYDPSNGTVSDGDIFRLRLPNR